MKKLLFIAAMVLYCFCSSFAQENTRKNIKIYETWISLIDRPITLKSLFYGIIYNNPNKVKGVLYEIKDSSILVLNSRFRRDYLTGNFKVSEVYYNNIDNVQIRRKSSIDRGTIICVAAGLAGAIALAKEISSDRDEFTGVMVLLGVPIIGLTTCIGSLAGAIKIKIPINGSVENFYRNESRLQKFSYVQEYSNGSNLFEKAYEHKQFIGIVYSLSIPLGSFADKSPNNGNAGFAKAGGGAGFVLGWRFTQNLGLSILAFNNQYSVAGSGTDKFWNLGGIIAGPMFSIPVKDKLFFNLKPMIGSASSSLYANNNEEKSGIGFGINCSASLRYNFSKRWCI